jgi:lipopolysaccharide export system ATP-binding protein
MHRRAQLGIGYLAQEPSIFRRLSIQDNLLLIMEQTGVPRRLWQQRLNQLLEEFRIAPRGPQPGPAGIGGGASPSGDRPCLGRWDPRAEISAAG